MATVDPTAVQPVLKPQLGGPQVGPMAGAPDPYVAGPQAPQSTSYAALTPIDPAQDYRSQAITPGADPRLAATQNQTNSAANAVAGSSYQAPQTNDAYTQAAQGYTQQAAGALGSGQVAGTDTSKAQSILDRAIQQAGTLSTQQGGGLNYGADTSALRAALAGQSGNLLNGAPSREDLANKQFALLQEQSNPQFQQDLRGVGQKAAALGRIGAGMTTSDLGDVAQRRNQAFSQAARGLSYDAAGQAVNDRLSALQAATGGFGALAGADQAQADANFRGSSLGSQNALNSITALRGLSGDQLGLSGVGRQEGVQDRAYGLDRSNALSGLSSQSFGQGQGLRNENRLDQGNAFDQSRNRLADLSGLEGQQFNQGLTQRNELRGERTNQQQQAQQGIDNALTQYLTETGQQNTGFNQNQAEQNQNYTQGYGGYPGAQDAYNTSSQFNQAGADQTFGGVGDLLSEYLKQKGGGAAKPGKAASPLGSFLGDQYAGIGEG